MGLVTISIVLCALVLGTFSAMAPLGPVTVLVIQRALGGDTRGALKLGLGRVPAETLYCGLATFGMVALLEQFPGARLAIETLGTAVFLVVGLWLILQRPPPAATEGAAEQQADPEPRASSNWTGFVISMLNPTLILSWSAGIAITVSMLGFEPTLVQKILFPLSLGSGIALGYTLLVAILRRYGAQLEDRLVRRAIQLMGALFVGLSLWNAVTLLRDWL